MLDSIPATIPLEYAAMMAIAFGIVLRFYFGDTLFNPRYVKVWNGIRRFAIPILNRLAERKIGITKLENHTSSAQYVATIDEDVSVKELSKEFNTVRDFEVPLLAGFKTDWENRDEIGTLVAYHGDKLFPGSPHWLRERQLHVTFFRNDEGCIVVTAHEEANSYRPDLWRDHLFEHSFDIEQGTRMTTNILEDLGYL